MPNQPVKLYKVDEHLDGTLRVVEIEAMKSKRMYRLPNRIHAFGFRTQIAHAEAHTSRLDAINAAIEGCKESIQYHRQRAEQLEQKLVALDKLKAMIEVEEEEEDGKRNQ